MRFFRNSQQEEKREGPRMMYYEPFLYFAIELLRGAEKVSEPIS